MSQIPESSINAQAIPRPASAEQNDVSQQDYMRLPPNLIRIRADDNDKKTMICYWVLFIAILIVMSILMFLVPTDMITKSNETELHGTVLESCKNPSGIDQEHFTCGDFSRSNPKVGLILTNLVPANQFFLVFLEVYLSNNGADFNITQEVHLEEYGLVKEPYTKPDGSPGSRFAEGEKFFNQTFNLTMTKKNSSPIRQPHRRSITGYKKFFAYEYNVEKTKDQFLLMTFLEPNGFQNIEEIKMVVVTVNPRFSMFAIVLRILFFIASLSSCIVFMLRYRHIPAQERTIEQKLIAIQSILLILFNDPLYGITILAPNGFMTFYSVFVVVNFTIFLLFTWIIFIERVLYENGLKETQLINWKKIVYIILVYMLSLILLCFVAFFHFQKIPIVTQYDVGTMKFLALKIICFVVVLVGFVYIIIQYIRSCISLNTKLWRNKLFIYFVLFFIVVSWGLFIFEGYNIFGISGSQILLLFTLANVYTFYLQHMYSIADSENKRIKSGELFYDDRKEVHSIMSDMNYDQVNLDLGTEGDIYPKALSNPLKENFYSKNGKQGMVRQNQQEDIYDSEDVDRSSDKKKKFSSFEFDE